MTNGPMPHDVSERRREIKRLLPAIVLASTLSSCMTMADSAEDEPVAATDEAGWPAGDPEAGKTLFVDKGCVICHSVNGVGGRAALPLDAPPDGRKVDPMVFAAAMWDGASAMISLQFTELGYQIGITGAELRDLATFASDLETQATFSLDDIPEDLRPWIIDAPHWLDDDWPEPFESLPDGTQSPFEDL
ncbi:MAG: c-type cytochrome [Geminicoccaceae bacterium]